MKILVSGYFFKLIKSLENLSLDEKLAPFAEKTLAVSLSDKAEANARNVIGNGPFGQELAEGVRTVTDGPSVTVDHVTNDTNHLAEHVHEGGVIRPRNRKYLAIPILQRVKKEYASDHSWNTPDGKPIVVRKKEDGPNGRAYLAEPTGKKGKLKFLYVLKHQTKPQKPRPWWPTDEDFVELAEREVQYFLDKLGAV